MKTASSLCILLLVVLATTLLTSASQQPQQSLQHQEKVEEEKRAENPLLWFWVVNKTERVMPTTLPPSTPNYEAQLSMAANEYESFQIAIRFPVNATIQMLPNLFQLPLTWEQVGYVWVDNILPNSQGGKGWWPDVLLHHA